MVQKAEVGTQKAFIVGTTEEEIKEEELRATHTDYTYWIWRQ